MDTIVRIAVILALIAYGLYRLVRYFRHGVAKRVTALPPSVGMPLAETASVAVASSSVPESQSARFMVGLITLAVWMGANCLLSAALFATPALSGVPAIWRLFVLIFANFYIFPFAKASAERRYRRKPGEAAQNANPFGN